MINLSAFMFLFRFGPPTRAMMRGFPEYVHLFFTTVHSHMISLAEADRERFYTNMAILMGVYEQIFEQLGNRPMTSPLSCIYWLMQYLLDTGRDPWVTFSDSILRSYLPAFEHSHKPMSNICQVRNLTIFQLQLQHSLEQLHVLNLLFDDGDGGCTGLLNENITLLEDLKLFIHCWQNAPVSRAVPNRVDPEDQETSGWRTETVDHIQKRSCAHGCDLSAQQMDHDGSCLRGENIVRCANGILMLNCWDHPFWLHWLHVLLFVIGCMLICYKLYTYDISDDIP